MLLIYSFVFFTLLIASYFLFLFSCKSYVGMEVFQNRRDKKLKKQTFWGRYLFLDFSDFLPKYYYICFFFSIAGTIGLYVCMLLSIPNETIRLYRTVGGYMFRLVLLCDVIPSLPHFLARRNS